MDQQADFGVMDGIASTLRHTSSAVDGLGNSVPGTPDAGDGTPAIIGIMARLVDNAGQLVIGTAAAGDAVIEGKGAYQQNEASAANDVRNAPGAR
ncbi:hypothetical protein [Amycolatopsis sp. H20-H5]|uniref:hypothetical protein n=1 Tax=Amycolatopsis sp. H20-H5 TaxID=3046309 RepID=UPI002DB5E677|nr:hypothetical protein [Amycolatopsis sp. H20-H5]MEC3977960.1 hypothetical protein [Amycolatopsis sp. H20-H5]